MPDLDSPLHLDMLRSFRVRMALPTRVWKAVKRAILYDGMYGLEWGDPESVEPLRFIRDRYVLPYVNPDHVAVEIGPGGGRWTRYLLGFRRVYAVDYHAELLQELKRYLRRQERLRFVRRTSAKLRLNVEFVKNHGFDFPGIPPDSVDYVCSFGCFVHLDAHLIEGYLQNLRPIVKPGSSVVIQYSDKSKIMAQMNTGFSDNAPEKMRQMVTDAGFTILEEDLTTIWHSSVIRFTR